MQKQYYAPTESRARKAGTVQKHQHLIVIMIRKFNTAKDKQNRKEL